MTKTTKEILLAFSIITIFCAAFMQSGCNSVSEEYITRLDTLDQKLALNAKYLSIDLGTIQVREQTINKELQYMRKYYDKIYTQELGNNLTKYKGIRKTYSNFLQNYPTVFNEMKALEKQAADLRTSVNKGEIDKSEFKKYYQTELNDVNINLAFSEKLSKAIHALEPEYQRISAMVKSELRQLATRDPEFLDTLERDSSEILD